jgi:hypothetical protein
MSFSSGRVTVHRGRDFISYKEFGFAPQTEVLGGAAGTALGIDADAANFALTKTAATARYSRKPVLFVDGASAVNDASPQAGASSGWFLQPFGSKNVVGAACITTGTTIIRPLYHVMPIPNHWDRKNPIYPRVVWSHDDDAAGDVQWLVKYQPLAENSSLLTGSMTGLNTAIALQTGVSGVGTYQRSPQGVMNGKSLAETDHGIQWEVNAAGIAGWTSSFLYFLGLEITYTPKTSRGLRREARSRGS